MKLSVFFLCFLLSLFATAQKEELFNNIEQNKVKYAEVAQNIWEYAEVGYQEEKSSEDLISLLREAGFKISKGVAEIPTAFIAEYNKGGPIIGILGEYDALPGLSQTNEAVKRERDGVKSGHACGHNLFGVASAAAAISIKKWLESSKEKGTIRFYGCPAEEGGSGKVYMVREGLFEDVDIVLHWHPSGNNNATVKSSLANKTGKFRFYGTSSHAASAPEQGRSALDGLEAMNNMLNLMREHVDPESRIHYVITKGGDAPNVVPNFAEGYYYVRHPNPEEVRNMWSRLELCAKGAAMGTETEVDYEVLGGVYNILPNETLQRLVYKELDLVGGVYYDQKEREYAEKIKETLQNQIPLIESEKIIPFAINLSTKGGGSTDVGDVSWAVPTAGFSTATYVPGTPGHSWQAASCTGTSIGHKGMINAAKVLSASAYELIKNPKIIKEARVEFENKRGKNYIYNSLIGDRKPALNYRN